MKATLTSWGNWLVREILRYPFPLLFEGAWTEQELAAARGQLTRVSPARG